MSSDKAVEKWAIGTLINTSLKAVTNLSQPGINDTPHPPRKDWTYVHLATLKALKIADPAIDDELNRRAWRSEKCPDIDGYAAFRVDWLRASIETHERSQELQEKALRGETADNEEDLTALMRRLADVVTNKERILGTLIRSAERFE